MAEKTLKLHQMLALLPVGVPECVLDFMEDLGEASSLQRASVKASLEPPYLQQNETALKQQMEDFRKDMGSVTQVSGEALGKEFPGAYICKVVFEKGSRGLGFMVKIKENQISKVAMTLDDYKPEDLKTQLKP
jgi:hypothetical protein